MGHATRPVQITIGETSHNRYDLKDTTIILDVITIDEETLKKHQTDTVVKLEEKVRKELGFIRNEEYNGIEWWQNKSAFQLIEEMKVYLFGFKARETFQPRERQKDAIKKIIDAINMGHKQFLLGALMRFGKNFTVLWALSEVLKNKPTKRILYWTFKPGVFVSLEKDIHNHIKFQDYQFRLLKDTKSTQDLPTSVIVAASRQLVENKSNGSLLEDILSLPWDAIVVDECHAGIETKKGQAE
jgi:type I site-specific restriction endonuclease